MTTKFMAENSQIAQPRAYQAARELAILVSATLFVALCARISIPLPFTPVPLTLQNMGVVLVGLLLGSRRGFAAMLIYLAEGISGMPVFSPAGPGGILQVVGFTGGYLMAYPFVAFVAGYIFERGTRSFVRAALASLAGEILLFAGGVAWLYALTHSLSKAAYLGLYSFIAAEVLKIMFAAAIANRWGRFLPARQ